MGKMQKAVIYTRVSTDEQAKNGLSLKGQEDAARDYCKREQMEVAEVFCDAGESAKTADRPQLIASIAYCTEHYKEIDYYVVWKMDRFARMAYDSVLIDANLQKLGIELRSVTEPITKSPIGNLTKTMLAGFAQFDNEVRAERSSSGAKRRIEEGGWPHMAPLGYKNYKDSLQRPTLVQTAQATVIAKWLKQYLRGGYTQFAMNDLAWTMGIRSKKGKRLSNQQTINMLRNPIYAGLVFSKMLKEPIKGLHEGVISITDHEEILDRLDNRKRSKNSLTSSREWPLRGGFIKCAECGESITGSAPKGRTKHYPMYHCRICRVKKVGHKVSVPKEKMHHEFEALLHSVTPSEATLKLFKLQVIKKWNYIHMEQLTEQQRLQQDLVKLNERKQRVVTLYIDGNLTSDEKNEQTTRIESEILRTEFNLNQSNSDSVSSDVLINFGINMIQNAPKLWRVASEIDQQRLQIAIFPEGLTYDFVKGFGTGQIGELYEVVQELATKKSNLVDLNGFSWNRLYEQLRVFYNQLSTTDLIRV